MRVRRPRLVDGSSSRTPHEAPAPSAEMLAIPPANARPTSVEPDRGCAESCTYWSVFHLDVASPLVPARPWRVGEAAS